MGKFNVTLPGNGTSVPAPECHQSNGTGKQDRLEPLSPAWDLAYA